MLAGPSGVGKSTLIARLLGENPGQYGFSVSTTTRPPRAGEADGVDYYFVNDDTFDRMIERDEFIEWANVGGQRYGTSVGGVSAVTAGGKTCLLDLDVQGVQSLAQRTDLLPYFIWIAAPSLDVLRARLRGRGTEDNDEISRRMSRALGEIEYALSSRVFDKTILNDELDECYAQLKAAIDDAAS